MNLVKFGYFVCVLVCVRAVACSSPSDQSSSTQSSSDRGRNGDIRLQFHWNTVSSHTRLMARRTATNQRQYTYTTWPRTCCCSLDTVLFWLWVRLVHLVSLLLLVCLYVQPG